MNPSYINGLTGGILIGLAAALLLWCNGRIAGISGIAGSLLGRPKPGEFGWRALFIAGLPLGAGLYALLGPGLNIRIDAGPGLLIAAGLLVGFGTRMGSGCTSGHGICGIARLSPRSITATLVFMATGMVAVYILRAVTS